ncbi:MAG: uracil-DNA glycosylase family protein [Thiovulaceae bacterium]|nr:uracil-DNA glycosylase family protein [Sulfurimonadaceae bacterium]
MKSISNCSNCTLCNNQKPLLDKSTSAHVMWIGLSAKKVESLFSETPLAANTNTGKIVAAIESKFNNLLFYKTNIVKCLPLDDKKKLRYPNHSEMSACYDNFEFELKTIKPNLVFLLGKKVSDFIYKQQKNMNYKIEKIEGGWIANDITYMAIHHPSYIYVYKRKFIDNYINEVQLAIEIELANILCIAS